MAKIFALREIRLLPHVTLAEFETFMRQRTPALMPWPGINQYTVKGDQGDGVERGLKITEFESNETRNRYFPDTGEASTFEIQKLLVGMADFVIEHEKYAPFFSPGIPYTDRTYARRTDY